MLEKLNSVDQSPNAVVPQAGRGSASSNCRPPRTTNAEPRGRAADAKLVKIQRLVAAHPEVFARQGAVVATWRTVAGRRLGPYYSLRYRAAGRQHAVYLGRSADLAAAVDALVTRCQQPYRDALAFERMAAAVRASLRQNLREVRRQLQPAGLMLKGFEVRGWRTALPQPDDAAESSERTMACRTVESRVSEQ